MKTESSYQPGAVGEATVRDENGKWALVFVRELKHPPERVWRVLTDPDELREWAPFDATRALGSVGATTLIMAGGSVAEETPCKVLRAERPRLLEYDWGGDLLRWELEPQGQGTRLTLRHTVSDPSWLPKVAAGWHICVDVAERLLDGRPVGRIVAGAAKRHGWERLNTEYAARFGVEDTGWPEGVSTS